MWNVGCVRECEHRTFNIEHRTSNKRGVNDEEIFVGCVSDCGRCLLLQLAKGRSHTGALRAAGLDATEYIRRYAVDNFATDNNLTTTIIFHLAH